MEKTAVIGMGSSGMAAVLAYYKEADPKSFELDLFDSPESFGRGYPYRDDTETLILNLKVPKISFDYENNDDFPSWYKEKGYEIPQYAPRKTFGEYTSERLKEIIEKIGAKSIHEKVIRIDRTEYGWEVETETGRISVYDRIHFAAGELSQKKLKNLKDEKNYFPLVYPISSRLKPLTFISPEEKILIVGTGLTAADTASFLLKETNAGSLTIYSEGGIIPTVRVAPSEIKVNILTPEKLSMELKAGYGRITFERFDDLFTEELLSHGIKYEEFLKTHMMGGLEGLRYNIDNPHDLSVVQALLPPMNIVFNKIWDSMGEKDRVKFRKKYHPFMCLNRSPLPLETAELLIKGEDEGRLHFRRGKGDIRQNEEGKFILTKGSGNDREEFDYVINAAGLDVFINNSENTNPLLYQILDKRYVMKDTWGGLFAVPDTMEAISPIHGTMKGFHIYGVLASGIQYRNNSTLIIQHTAHRVIKNLISEGKLKGRNAVRE